MKRFLIADDHFIVRSGISLLLKSEFLNAEVDECNDGPSLWQKLEKGSYDLLMLDIFMPGLDSVALLKDILARRPGQKVLVFSISSEEIYAKKYLEIGARGYLNKAADEAEIRTAIVSILNNRRYLSPKMHDILAAQSLGMKNINPFDALSGREAEVLPHILDGKSVTEIGRLLSMRTTTAATYKARILRKLGVNNVVDLIRMAQMFSAENDPGY
jgi:DNA-binding NarL/FixJ family response regulator